MDSKNSFVLAPILSQILASGKKETVFTQLLFQIETFHNRAVSSMTQLKIRDNKKFKGDVWENICQKYLQAVSQYSQVWLWNEIPSDVRLSLKLISRVDNGIDIIAQTTKGKFHAVQCKYRKKIASTVPWNTLATFVGLCGTSGPWEKQIVMTNCRGITRKIPRTPKDKSICFGTFNNLDRVIWLKMADAYVEHRLDSGGHMINSDDQDIDNKGDQDDNKTMDEKKIDNKVTSSKAIAKRKSGPSAKPLEPTNVVSLTKEELRDKRLKYFQSLNQ